MSIIAKAKELGEAIGASTEMAELKRCEAEVEKDRRSKTLISDLKLLQLELMKAQKEKREPEIVDAIKERLDSKHEELNNYDTTKKYIEAKNRFDGFMKTINSVIIFGITGEEPCSPNKCGTCSGGCE